MTRIAALALVAAISLAACDAKRPVVAVTEHAEAEIVAASDALEPGRTTLVALRLKANPGWHTYWRNPGDSGQPTSIAWQLPEGFSAGPIRWPVPQRMPVGPLANYGYEGEVLLASEIRVPPGASGTTTLAAKAKWLACDPSHCIPEQADLRVALPVASAGQGKPNPKFEAIRLPQPAPADWKVSARRDGNRVLLDVAGADESALYFFPYDEGKVQHAAAQPIERTATGIRLAVPVSTQPVGEFTRVRGVLAAGTGRAFEVDVPVQ
jgi:thiol:disulfide interchange protein DsbD